MEELFSRIGNFQVVRLCDADARGVTDHLKAFRELVLENQPMYPHIDKWIDRKVIPGMQTSERIGYIGYLDGIPVVSAVVKRGEFAKFCHLRIKDDLQDMHLGEAFFALMSLEIREYAKEIHFTLPESLWENENKFFSSFGFVKAMKAGHQYRLFDNELRCSSPFHKVWELVLGKLPKIARMFLMNGHSLDSRILMSIKSEYAKKVLEGKKKVEIRKRFSKKWAGHKVSIYATRPESSLVGEAWISKIVIGDPESIWEKFHVQIGCTRDEFNNYAGTLDKVYAIVLENPVQYGKSFSLNDVSNLTKKRLRPPQSYYRLENNKSWSEAVSMGALLQARFGIQEPAEVF